MSAQRQLGALKRFSSMPRNKSAQPNDRVRVY